MLLFRQWKSENTQRLSIRIGELCGNPDAIKIGARADDGLKYDLEWFDASALIEDTGYMPRISFDQGVLNTINWMKL